MDGHHVHPKRVMKLLMMTEYQVLQFQSFFKKYKKEDMLERKIELTETVDFDISSFISKN